MCLFLTIGLGLAVGCSKPAAAQAPALLITGSSTMAPLIAEMAGRFMVLHPGVRITVQAGGSARGIDDLRKGFADIGMVARAIGADEGDVRGFPLARDGVCLVVNRDNPVARLSDAQVRAIYRGTVTSWKSVGGEDAPILAFARSPGRAVTELFDHYFKLQAGSVKARGEIGDNAHALAAVTADRDVILYLSIGEAEHQLKAGAAIRLLPIGGVAASRETVRRGEYPLSRPLTLVTRSAPSPLVKELVNYFLSPQMADLIRQRSFVPYVD